MANLMISVIIVYFIIFIILSYIGYKRTVATPEDYYMGSRSFGTISIALTLFATNMTAVQMIGTPGLAYRAGVGAWGYMAIAAVMVVGFCITTIGMRSWILGKAYGYITPTELFSDRFESNILNYIFLLYYVVFGIAYLATATIGGGISLEVLTGGIISYRVGCFLMLAVTVIYVSLGSMRGTVWTDIIQAITILFVAIFTFF